MISHLIMTTETPRSSGPNGNQPLLTIEAFRIHFYTSEGVVKAFDDVTWDVNEGRRWHWSARAARARA